MRMPLVYWAIVIVFVTCVAVGATWYLAPDFVERFQTMFAAVLAIAAAVLTTSAIFWSAADVHRRRMVEDLQRRRTEAMALGAAVIEVKRESRRCLENLDKCRKKGGGVIPAGRFIEHDEQPDLELWLPEILKDYLLAGRQPLQITVVITRLQLAATKYQRIQMSWTDTPAFEQTQSEKKKQADMIISIADEAVEVLRPVIVHYNNKLKEHGVPKADLVGIDD